MYVNIHSFFSARQTLIACFIISEKVKVGNDQEMAHSERKSHSTNRGVGKNHDIYGYLCQENIS